MVPSSSLLGSLSRSLGTTFELFNARNFILPHRISRTICSYLSRHIILPLIYPATIVNLLFIGINLPLAPFLVAFLTGIFLLKLPLSATGFQLDVMFLVEPHSSIIFHLAPVVILILVFVLLTMNLVTSASPFC